MKYKITTNGTPKTENMSKTDYTLFCKSLLQIMISDKIQEGNPPDIDEQNQATTPTEPTERKTENR